MQRKTKRRLVLMFIRFGPPHRSFYVASIGFPAISYSPIQAKTRLESTPWTKARPSGPGVGTPEWPPVKFPHISKSRCGAPAIRGVWLIWVDVPGRQVTGAGEVDGVAHGLLVKSKKLSRVGSAASRAVRCAGIRSC